MYKMSYGDFEIVCPPCIHWWVRYAEFCTVHVDLKDGDSGLQYSDLAYYRDGKEYIDITDDEKEKYKEEIKSKFELFKHKFKDDSCPFVNAQYDCPLYFSIAKDMEDVKLLKGYCIGCGKHECEC